MGAFSNLIKYNKEFKIGVVVTVAIGLLVWGLNFLKGENILSTKQYFYAVYHKIDGLVEGNPVQVNGFKVGQVGTVSFHADKSGKVVVKFILGKETIALPRGTTARIISADLLGSKAVELMLAESDDIHISGDTLDSDIEADLQESFNATIAPLKLKAEELIGSMDSAVTIVQMILNEDARKNLGAGFESLKRSFDRFESASKNLDELISENKGRISSIFVNINGIAGNLNSKSTELSNILDNFSQISDSLAEANIAATLQSANLALQDLSVILEKINDGEGTMGMLINNDSLYNNLAGASLALDSLLSDVKDHPKRYVHFSLFGKKDK